MLIVQFLSVLTGRVPAFPIEKLIIDGFESPRSVYGKMSITKRTK